MSRTLVAVAILLALPASAQAGGFERVYRDFKQDGAIGACAYSDAQLAAVERSTPADVEQYATAFTEQLRASRLARARGDCEPAREPGRARAALAAGVAVPAIDTDAGASTPLAIWILAVVAGTAVLCLLVWLVGRRYGWSLQRFTRPLGAAVTEAGERTADLARDFWDWLRLGR